VCNRALARGQRGVLCYSTVSLLLLLLRTDVVRAIGAGMYFGTKATAGVYVTEWRRRSQDQQAMSQNEFETEEGAKGCSMVVLFQRRSRAR
jgi:hypothetical protein